MDIKNIHVLLIVVSIILCLGFGIWAFNHDAMAIGSLSFILTAGLVVYLMQFIKKMKAL